MCALNCGSAERQGPCQQDCTRSPCLLASTAVASLAMLILIGASLPQHLTRSTLIGTFSTHRAQHSLTHAPISEQQAQQAQRTPSPGLLTKLQLLQGCSTFECLRAAHAAAPAASTTHPPFNLPHFYIIGWQKAATTSLFAFLESHPQVLPSSRKETHFFDMHGCNISSAGQLYCSEAKVQSYLTSQLRLGEAVKGGLQRAAFEATPAYSRMAAELAPFLRAELPWVKLVGSLREPIARVASALVMTMDVKQFAKFPAPFVDCLERLEAGRTDLYTCIKTAWQLVPAQSGNYSQPLAIWLQAFPRDQVHIVQYETLSSPSTQAGVLRGVQQFLGLDPDLIEPKLPSNNSRKGHIRPQGWPMQRWQYEELVEAVRPDAERVASLVEQYGHGARTAWLSAWEGVWRRNLEGCSKEGECSIKL